MYGFWLATHSAAHTGTLSRGPGFQWGGPFYFGVMGFATSSGGPPPDPYELLGVSSTATAKEIKLGYFKAAKKYHPDLNPNDPKAAEKFQQLADAYETLKDPTSRAHYDKFGWKQQDQGQQSQQHQQQNTQQQYQQSQWAGYQNYGGATHGQKSATDTWSEMWADAEIIAEALNGYSEELIEETHEAVDAVKAGDWATVAKLVGNHKIVFGGMAGLFVLLRWPAAAVFVATMGIRSVPMVIKIIAREPRLIGVLSAIGVQGGRHLHKLVMDASRRQLARDKARREAKQKKGLGRGPKKDHRNPPNYSSRKSKYSKNNDR